MKRGKESGKRGRGTEKQLIQAAVSLNEQKNPQFARLETQEDVTSQSIMDFVERNIKEGSIIKTDKYRSYEKALKERYIHHAEKFDVKENPEHLKWLHRVIGNLKTFILGTYHGLGKKHLQAYLGEFCFRFNRRTFSGQTFNRLLNACMFSAPFTYKQLVKPVLT